MAETVQQYIARLTGLVGERDALAIMAATPARLEALVAGASEAALRWRPSPERWSAAMIAAHLADAEVVGAWRFRSVLGNDGVRLQAYDQDMWASAFKYERVDPREAVALFGALRRSTLRVLHDVEPARLQHAGLHDERGREPIAHLTRMFAGHDLNHLAQIERLLAEAPAPSA